LNPSDPHWLINEVSLASTALAVSIAPSAMPARNDRLVIALMASSSRAASTACTGASLGSYLQRRVRLQMAYRLSTAFDLA
jgi:hypothetical protein